MAILSVIQKSQLEGAKRLDAEYYQPEYLDISNKLRSNKFYTKFSSIFSSGNYGILPDSDDYISEKDQEGIYLIRGIDLRGVAINEDDLIKVPKKYVNKKAQANKGDLLFLVKGATIDAEDSVSIVPNLSKSAIFNGSIFRPLLKDGVFPEFVFAFMRTKYFYMQKRRLVSNIGIEYNSVFEIENYDFLLPPVKEQTIIKNIVNSVFEYIENSKNYYRQAENLLLEEIGLGNFKVDDDLSWVMNLSDVKPARRADAEYFQPKYKKIVEYIKKNRGGVALGELVTIKKGVEPGAEEYQDEGKQFIRVSSLSKQGISDSGQKYLSEELYQKLKDDFEPRKGEVLLTKDASPGIAYVLKEDIKGIMAGGILRLKLNPSTSSGHKMEVENEYLALCLNSIVGQMQAERDSGGSVIAHWKPEEIKNVVIPILPQNIQRKISDLICQSFEARKKAKELLEEAKRKVEEMVERGGEG